MELADRLPFCPRCSYPFTGLPEAHQCPECGLAYDLESRMWTSVASRWGMHRAINLGLGLIAIAVGVIQFVGIVVWPLSAIERIGRLAFGVFLFCVARFFLQARQRDHGPQSRFIAVMPDGIWYVDQIMVRHNILWTQARSVEKQSRYVDLALKIHLIPKGVIDIHRDMISYPDAEEVISLAAARLKKSTQ